jgi:drug/metabolite transporter (DMT)-like permease
LTPKQPKPDVVPYISPLTDQQSRKREVFRIVIGVFAGIAATFFVIIFWVVISLNFGGQFQMRTMVVPILVTLGVLAVPWSIATYFWRRNSKGFAVGALIGIGVAGLILGICWVAKG